MAYLLAALSAYLIGSFPSGVAVVRIVRGIDVRWVGSRRSGATNVFRAAGWGSALVVFLLDTFKGAAAVWLGMELAERAGSWGLAWPLAPTWIVPLWAGMAAGLAAIAGHNWPIYVRFQGGRGVATTLGTIIPLAPVVAAVGFAIGITIILVSRYASLGSLIGAGTIPAGLLVQSVFVPVAPAVIVYGALVAGIIILQHRDNIARLRAGTERKLGGTKGDTNTRTANTEGSTNTPRGDTLGGTNTRIANTKGDTNGDTGSGAAPRPGRWSAVPGYVATVLLILATALWTFWGMGELYYEGWGQPFPAPLAYLVPAAACLVLTLAALRWPAVGGGLLLVGGGAFTAWWWTMTARRGGFSLGAALSMFPLSGVLILAGALLLLEARHRRQRRAAGWTPPRRWVARNLRYLLALGLPLLVAVAMTAFNLASLLGRLDDGDYGAREIAVSYGAPLVWAPADGPGWVQGSNVGRENWSWNRIAWYGVPPVGQSYRDLGDATEEDMRSTGLCRYLSADGQALLETPQDIWRMPTREDIVRSLVRDGRNAGCTWAGDARRATCQVTPDKETPLWDPGQLAIYYWAGDSCGAGDAAYVGYNGNSVSCQPKAWGNPRHGFRCVRDPEE